MKNEVVICGVPFERPDAADILKKMKKDGVTAVQIYTHWKNVEGRGRGEFDFSCYDKYVYMIKEAGLKFVPFILIGPRWSAPDWWLESEGHKGLVCLEHNQECPVESIWNPEFRTEVDRVLKAFAEHYLPMDILESVQPGICGDYGEAIMPVHGNWAGAYHTHKGMWCGGEDAISDFRRAMQKKYETIENLNSAWRSCYSAFGDVTTFKKSKSPSRTAWFDLVDWYRASMTEYVDFWMAATRKYFPDTPVYMCTGGIESPEHAALFSDQAKVCAKYNGGLRLTNERNKFFSNFFDCTAYTRTACEFYGSYLGLEPVGTMTTEGIGSRIFSSAVFGNPQIFFYFGNIYPGCDMNGKNSEIFAKYISLIQSRKTNKETSVLWPAYVGIEEGGIPERIRETATFIRQRTDFSFINENMIADGILDSIKVLIIPCTVFSRRDVLLKIRDWVEKGGILFAAGRVTDLELEAVPEFDEMFGFTAETCEWGGNQTYIVCENIPYKKLIESRQYYSDTGYAPLAEDAVVLSECPSKFMEQIGIDTVPVYNAFYRDFGKGRAITYLGPLNFKNDAQEIHHGEAFPALLDDIISNYAKDLKIAGGEVVRGEIDGVVYALYPDGEIKKI